MVKEKSDFRFVNQMGRDATDEEFADTLSPISPHHQHVDVILRDVGFDNSSKKFRLHSFASALVAQNLKIDIKQQSAR